MLARGQNADHIRQFFAELSIKTISLGANTCINNRNPVTDVFVLCLSKQGSEFKVSFKLQTVCADICNYLLKIENAQEVHVAFT